MAVFVDDMRAQYGRMIMCHMGADTTEELLEMADKIGVARKWLQCAGTWREHFDIALSKRSIAVQYGAIEVTQREFVIRKSPKIKSYQTPPLSDALSDSSPETDTAPEARHTSIAESPESPPTE